jgi:hypothetical protein
VTTTAPTTAAAATAAHDAVIREVCEAFQMVVTSVHAGESATRVIVEEVSQWDNNG